MSAAALPLSHHSPLPSSSSAQINLTASTSTIASTCTSSDTIDLSSASDLPLEETSSHDHTFARHNTPLEDKTLPLDHSFDTSFDYSSSGDEGVFFGSRQDVEDQFVAKLSKILPLASPASSSSAHKGPRRSSIIRVKKRDSREYLRRKTLLLPDKESLKDELIAADRVWEGGMVERKAEDEARTGDERSSAPQTPEQRFRTTATSTDVADNLVDQLAQLNVSDCMDNFKGDGEESEIEEGDFTSEEEELDEGEEDEYYTSEDDLEGSDKENTIIPTPYSPGNEEEDEEPYVDDVTEDPTVMANFGNVKFDHVEALSNELDMGGLNLNDFDDPDSIIQSTGDEYADGDLGPGSDGTMSASTSESDLQQMAASTSAVDVFTASATGDEKNEESHNAGQVRDVVEDESEVEDEIASLEQPTTSDEEGSPLPVARAGPVVIPLMQHHLAEIPRAPSPLRGLAPILAMEQTVPDSPVLRLSEENISALEDLDRSQPISSPEKPEISVAPSAPHPSLQMSTSTPVSRPIAHQPNVGLGASRTIKTLKSSQNAAGPPLPLDRSQALVTSTAARAPIVQAPLAARKVEIRGQLDAAFAPRLARFGPPSRSASSASSASSSSTVSGSRPTMNVVKSRPRPAESSTTSAPIRRPAVPPSAPTVSRMRMPAPQPAKKVSSIPTATPSMVPRPAASFAKPAVAAPRQPMTNSRLGPSLPHAAPARISTAKQIKEIVVKTSMSNIRQAAHVPVDGVAVKRAPLTLATATARALVPVNPTAIQPVSRPSLGQPSRLVRDGPHGPVYAFSISGVEHSADIATARPTMFRSPGKLRRPFIDGSATTTPPRAKMGTPLRPQSTPYSMSVLPPSVSKAGSALKSQPLFKSATLSGSSASDQLGVEPSTDHRGSSEDCEDASFAIPQAESSDVGSSPVTRSQTAAGSHHSEHDTARRNGSPTPTNPANRPKRATKTPETFASSRGRQPGVSNALNMSEKELKTTTHRNTMRNQVYLCAIDRQIIRVNGPRPPSPTSKIRTIAQREEEEKKAGREARAKRRSKSGSGDEDSEGEMAPPPVERLSRTRGPGDDDDYTTPAPPSKRHKISHGGGSPKHAKSVRWDKNLIVIRGGLGESGDSGTPSSTEEPSKGCIPNEARIHLDHHGNVLETERPVEKLKRMRIVVTAVFYDGEEPVPEPAASTRSKKK